MSKKFLTSVDIWLGKITTEKYKLTNGADIFETMRLVV